MIFLSILSNQCFLHFLRTSQILTPLRNWLANTTFSFMDGPGVLLLHLQPRAESGTVYDCQILQPCFFYRMFHDSVLFGSTSSKKSIRVELQIFF